MNAIEELRAIQARLSTTLANVKSASRDLTDAEIKSVEADTLRATELKAQIDRGQKSADLMDNIGALGADTGNEFGDPTRGYLSPAGIKSMAKTGASHGIKALVAGGSSTTAIALDTNPIRMGQPNLGLLSLIPTKVRDTPQYSYLRQTVRTNNASVVAPGGTKPTSIYTVASVTGSLAVVAHLSEAIDKYLLEDNADLERFLQGELQNGVIRKVTADAIAAFSATPGIQTYATSASYTTQKGFDGIYTGSSLLSDLGYTANVLILSRATYDALRLAKDGEQRYFGGNPFEGGALPALWGMQTLVSADVPANTALVLDSSQVGISVDRAGIQTAWDAITGFAVNTVRARTEARFGYDVYSPSAVAKITFTA